MKALGKILLTVIVAWVAVHFADEQIRKRATSAWDYANHDKSERDGFVYHAVVAPKLPMLAEGVEYKHDKIVPITVAIDNNTYREKNLPESLPWRLTVLNGDQKEICNTNGVLRPAASDRTLEPGQRWVRYIGAPFISDLKGAAANEVSMRLSLYETNSITLQVETSVSIPSGKG